MTMALGGGIGTMLRVIRRDARRYFDLDAAGAPRFADKLRALAESPGFQAVLVHRLGSYVHREIERPVLRRPLKLLCWGLHKACIVCWGIHIDVRAEIGPGLYVGHFGGVLIGPAKIGRDCNIAHQVTIGARADGARGLPVLGDRVWVGTGSVIHGEVRIADGVTIGPLTVVSRSLPGKVLVAGNPMRIIRRDYDNSAAIHGGDVVAADHASGT
jgi:serine O-acetyltransferase